MARKKIMIIAGESSGDLHGARLAAELKIARRDLDLFGLGGASMREAGVRILADPTAVAVIGLIEVLKHLDTFKALFRKAADALDAEKPDLVVLIDYPGFNLRFAREVKRRGIRLAYFISPQIWAWNSGRIHRIKQLVDRMIVVFPFEKAIYERGGVPVTFVGHPLLEHVRPKLERMDALEHLGFADGLPVIGLLPGSREVEVRRILPVLLATGERMKEQLPSTARFLLIKSPHLSWEIYKQALERSTLQPKVVERWDYDCIHICDLVLVASGTATLECALLGRPMLIVYKTSWPTYLISRLLIRIPVIGLVNVIASADDSGRMKTRRIAPEFIQHRATPNAIADGALNLWKSAEKRRQMQADFEEIRGKLGGEGAVAKAATAVLQELDQAKTAK